MARGTCTIAATIALAVTVGVAPPASAQGGVPLGSTTIVGPVDSLFNQFLAFLNAHGDSATSVDRRRHAVEAKVQGVDESIVFRFVSRGDSTTVTAQGTKGGMAALIMGLGVVHDWLEAKGRSGSDSSAFEPSRNQQRPNRRLKLAGPYVRRNEVGRLVSSPLRSFNVAAGEWWPAA